MKRLLLIILASVFLPLSAQADEAQIYRDAKPDIFSNVGEADDLPSSDEIPQGAKLELVRLAWVDMDNAYFFLQILFKDEPEHPEPFILMTVKVFSEYDYDGERISRTVEEYPIDLTAGEWETIKANLFTDEFSRLPFHVGMTCSGGGRFWLETYQNGSLNEIYRDGCETSVRDAQGYVDFLIMVVESKMPDLAAQLRTIIK